MGIIGSNAVPYVIKAFGSDNITYNEEADLEQARTLGFAQAIMICCPWLSVSPYTRFCCGVSQSTLKEWRERWHPWKRRGRSLTRNHLNRSLEAGTASIHYSITDRVPRLQHTICSLIGALTPKKGSVCAPIEIDAVPSEVIVQRRTNMRMVFSTPLSIQYYVCFLR